MPISEELLTAHGGPQGAVDALIDQVVEALYTRRRATEMVELTHSDGQVEILHVADLVSGAMLANIVDRAKKAAVKDLVTSGKRGLTREHLRCAVIEEISIYILFTIMIVPSIFLAYRLISNNKYTKNVENFIKNEFTDKEIGRAHV